MYNSCEPLLILMTIARIPARIRSGTALVVLTSYVALVLVLALHHHQHGVSPSPSYTAVHADGYAGHMHSASECPLQLYAVTAFHYLPSDGAAPAFVPDRVLETLPAHTHAISGHLRCGLSRAPPSIS